MKTKTEESMDAKTYNGYANYETWAVCLWLNNDESSYRYWKEGAEEARAEADRCWQVKAKVWSEEQAPVYLLAQWIRERLTLVAPNLEAGPYADLLNAALSEVDWVEVAASFFGDDEARDEKLRGRRLDALEKQKFPLGLVTATPNAIRQLPPADIAVALARHSAGDWGEVSPRGPAGERRPLSEDFACFSVYRSAKGEKFWVITEAERSSTTVLMPEDY